MKILVVNAGSSSLKYQLIDMKDESVIAKGNCERIGIDGKITHKTFDGREYVEECSFPTHTEAFEKLVEVMTKGDAAVIKDMSEIGAVGHRIVQGAEVFTKTTIVTDEVIDQIDGLADLAPVHNHAHALALRACKKVIPETTPQVVVFDTAFHQTMPPKAYMFAIPREYYEKYQVRRYGFHGTSHRYVSHRCAEIMGKDLKDLKLITCHLGNGSSITAIDHGKVVDTSMGLTPLDGFIMGTRSGSLDPSVVTFIMEKENLTPQQMSDILNKKSGMLGVTGISSDNRDIEIAAEQGNELAILSQDMFFYQVRKFIGSYIAAMNGVDAIVFTGGLGENGDLIRADVCKNMSFFGVDIDYDFNKTCCRGKEGELSTSNSKIKVYVIPTNEELLIARDTKALVEQSV